MVYCTYVNGDVVAWSPPANPGDAPTVVVSPSALKFSFTSGGVSPAPQNIGIVASTGAVNLMISSDSPWLVADRTVAMSPVTIAIQVNIAAMAPGSYDGAITITPAGGTPVTVGVNLLVNGQQ